MEKELAFHRLMEQVKRLYESSYGRALSDTDWVSFQEAVEEFDRVSGGTLIGRPQSEAPSFLLQPAKALEMLIPDDSTVDRRARTAVRKYDFVFQVVTDLRMKLQVGPIVDVALKRKGLRLGMSLGPYEKDINEVRATRKVFPEESMCGPYWSLYWHNSDIPHGYEVYYFKFDDEGVAHFHRRRWVLEIMGVKAAVEYSRELYDTFAQTFAKSWLADPGSFVRPPLLAVLHERFTFTNGPKPTREILFRHVAKGTPLPPDQDP